MLYMILTIFLKDRFAEEKTGVTISWMLIWHAINQNFLTLPWLYVKFKIQWPISKFSDFMSNLKFTDQFQNSLTWRKIKMYLIFPWPVWSSSSTPLPFLPSALFLQHSSFISPTLTFIYSALRHPPSPSSGHTSSNDVSCHPEGC